MIRRTAKKIWKAMGKRHWNEPCWVTNQKPFLLVEGEVMDLISEKIGDYLADLTVEVLGAKERKE